jgi:hypothetical protein
VTSAVFPDPQDAFDERLQDWRGWLGSHLVDAVAPMAYAGAARFAEQITAARTSPAATPCGPASDRIGSRPRRRSRISRPRGSSAPRIRALLLRQPDGPKPPAPDYLATVSRAAFGASRPSDSGNVK